jgi:hypothetical protein
MNKLLWGTVFGISCLAASVNAQTLAQLKAKYGDLVVGERCPYPDKSPDAPGQYCSPICKYGLGSGGGPMRCATKSEYEAELAEAQRPKPNIVQRLEAADAYYAFVQIPQVDEHLRPIKNQKGQPLALNLCLMWASGWDTENMSVMGDNPGSFYQHFSYKVNTDNHVPTIYAVDAPAVIASDNGTELTPTGGTRHYKANISAQMYQQPQSGWPCTQKDWDADMASVQIPEPEGGGSSGGGGGGYNPYQGPMYQGHHATSGSPQVICPPGAHHGAAGYCYR